MTVDELQVLITANTDKLQQEINNANKSINSLTKSANKTQAGMLSAFKKLKTGIIALGIGKIIKDSIQMGMDAVESDSLFEVSLGNMSDSVRAWSEEMQEALGVNAVAIRKNTGTIYNMTTSMGLAKENALKMSKGVAMLSNDMASFYNISQEEAFDKIQSGLTGMSKPLKDLGILVDDTTITQVAYANGIAKTGEELTEQQKVLARYVALLKQTGNAQGDLARTIDSPANQLRLLKSQVQQLGLAFSNILMPVIQAVLPYITAFTKVITRAVTSLAKFLGIANKGGGTETLSSNVGSIADGLSDADKNAKKLKGTLASFDEMNVIQDNSSDSGGSSGGGGSYGGTLDFDLSEYDAHLDWVDSSTQKIVENIEGAFGTLGGIIASIWDTAPVQSFVDFVVNYGQFLFDYYTTLATNLWTNLQTTWTNIETDVMTILTNMTTLWTAFWNDLSIGIQVWGPQITKGVTGVFNSVWKDAFDPAIKLMTGVWKDFTGILVDLWNEHGKTLVDNLGETVTNIIALFQKIWDDVIEPIITPLLETLSWLWDKHLKDMVQALGELVMSLVNGAMEIYNKFIHPIISWLLDVLAPAWAYVSSVVVGVLGTILGVVSDVITGIIKVLRGIIDFLTGVFTLNWTKVWNGVKEIFDGIWEAISGVVKGVVNLIIDALNGFISGLNKISFDVPDWVPIIGGKKWGFNIKKLKKLGTGGVVDKPMIAEIGEAGKEVVMPLERNTGWITELADKINARGGDGQPIHLTVNIGEDTFIDKIIEGLDKKSFENNGEVFNI